VCSGFFVLCLWSGQSVFVAVFMFFNLWIGPHFIFEPCTLGNCDVIPIPLPLGGLST
jgi:hypothetical protein